MKLHRHYFSVGLGICLILSGFLIGWTVIFWGRFCDEGDSLALGKWINHGLLPYRDLFSHHFPFVYYWLSLTFRSFGESIFSARMSVLCFEAVTMLLLAISTRQYLATGLFYFTWSLLAPYYLGNLVLYQRFSAITAVFIFGNTLRLITKPTEVTYPNAILIGLYAGVAILSYPIMAWFCIFSIVIIGFFSRRRVKTIASILVCFGMIGLTALFLILTDSWSSFIDQAIRFNTDIYSKYTRCNINIFEDVIPVALRLLNLFDPLWFNGSMQITWTKDQQIDQSIMTGFVYRLALILLSAGCIIRRRYVSGLYIYGSGALLMNIQKSHMRLMPFIFIAFYCLSLLATGWLQSLRRSNQTSGYAVRITLMRGLQIAALTAMINLQSQFSKNTYSDCSRLKYEVTFRDIERFASEINLVVQQDRSIPVAFYPGLMEMHFFLKNPPVGKYIYLWPWVAEIGLEDTISALKAQEAVLVINVKAKTWGRPCRVYLKRLIVFAQKHCWNFKGDIYLSPKLAARIIPVSQRTSKPENSVQYSRSPLNVMEQRKK